MRISLPKNYLVRLSKDIYVDGDPVIAKLSLNESEIAYLEGKYSVSVDSHTAKVAGKIRDAINGVNFTAVYVSMVYNFEESQGFFSKTKTRRRCKQLFCVFVFEAQDMNKDRVSDLDSAMEYPYGNKRSPNVSAESYLAKTMGVEKTKKLLSRYVGINSGFKNQVDRVRISLTSSISSASNTESDYCDFVFVGHGIGGSIAIICAAETMCTAKLSSTCDPEFLIVTFGAPKPGNARLRDIIRAGNVHVKRFVVNGDKTATLPKQRFKRGGDAYVHPCSHRSLGGRIPFCTGEVAASVDGYFRLIYAGLRIINVVSELADAVSDM